MPYISEDRKSDIRKGALPENVGELTFSFYQEGLWYLERHGESFQTYAEILAALQSASLELYRRRIGPYEDTKIQENGDV